MKQPVMMDQSLRSALVWSAILHIFLLIAVAVQWPHLFKFNLQSQQAIQVKIVAVNTAKSAIPAKAKPLEPQFTQQSNAPKEPPKPQPLKKAEAPKVSKANAPKVEKKVEEKPQTPSKEEQQKRPEKLDKTPDKKPVIKDDKAEPTPKKNDDFLKALSFIETLKEEQVDDEVAAQEGSETSTLMHADMEAINAIKKHISNNWYKPSGTKNSHEVLIEIRINRGGTLQNVRVLKGSGEAFFDNSLLRAVRKSEPIPYPSGEYNKFKIMEIYWNG